MEEFGKLEERVVLWECRRMIMIMWKNPWMN